MKDPKFTEILEEVQRIADDEQVPEIVRAIERDQSPPERLRPLYNCFIDRATKNIREREWAILKLTTP